jgi:hypothetical protein
MNTKKLNNIIKAIEDAGFGFAIVRSRTESEGRLIVSAEVWDDEKGPAADYYGEFHGGYSHIAPELEDIAIDNDAYWEWENPGAIVLYD